MSLSAIRAGLATALATTQVQRVYPEDVDNIEPICFVIGKPVGDYDDDFDGHLTYLFPCVLVTGRAGGADRSITAIDQYIEPTGASSVRAAINASNRLGGVCAAATVKRFVNFGEYVWADVSYIGVTFEIEVMT